ncbi:MAG: hypothetical protein JWN24_3553 [Phycisphaerales bacterium]|nr:hypothetical protein [Phycisphaerales bacterium]
MSPRIAILLPALLLMCFALSPTQSRSADTPAAKLVIVKAEFGDLASGKTADVTAKVAAKVKDNSLTIEATKANFGSAGSGEKKLKVSYTVDGVYRTKTVDEGETLDISTRLFIRKAVYGNLASKDQTADVTEQVADMVRSNKLSVAANNDNFGDPAGNVVKKLRVDYTFDGVNKSKTVGENQTLTISGKGE